MGDITAERTAISERYLSELTNPALKLPQLREDCTSVWHQFVVQLESLDKREHFVSYLAEHGIGTIVHYPIAPHLSEAYAYLGFEKGSFPIAEHYADTIVSLPLYNGMTAEEQDYVICTINQYGV